MARSRKVQPAALGPRGYLTEPETTRRMRAVGTKNTRPEIRVRKLLFHEGFRYRLGRRGLPGTPDVVFPSRKKVVFVHGCYWHRHPDCPRATTPKRNAGLWEQKFRRTIERDQENLLALAELGWKALVVWECELNDEPQLLSRLISFLDHDP